MALNIKDPETEQLAAEVAALAGESKTRAVRVALQERKRRLQMLHPKKPGRSLRQFLEEEIWPHVPPEVRGKSISKAEREEILGIGPDGV
ncbi:MAG TPA: type II toxin-antitoxin system VapB family antitoxin [Chloroflexota bacterium]|jgi:antitoxin VapB|nr:type II toxin-antitoxin system VapB family antitoxin [Chloroflexota bacterium]